MLHFPAPFKNTNFTINLPAAVFGAPHASNIAAKITMRRIKTNLGTKIIALGISPIRFCCRLPHKHPDHEAKDQN